MWMEGTGKVLSEGGGEMGKMKDGRELGYLLDLGPLDPSGCPGPLGGTQEGPVPLLSPGPRLP